MPPRELLTTLHVLAVITVVELLIRWLPLPRLSQLLGLRVDLSPPPTDVEPIGSSELPPHLGRQLRCSHRVADVWPFSQGPCLRRSLVIGHMLRRHDPALRLGVAGVGDELSAHAWIEIDGRPLERVDGLNVFQQTPTEAAR